MDKKNIQVTTEMYEFLINLSKEIKQQDNRATAMPYFFQVRETKEIPAHKGCGEQKLYCSEYEEELETDDEKVQWIKEHEEDFAGTMYEEDAKEVGHHTSTWDLDSMLAELGFIDYDYTYDYTYDNVFFTSKACDEYIKLNHHNLNQPISYLKHAFRNNEMDMIFKFILGLTDNDK